MALSHSNDRGFTGLEKEALGFIEYVSEKAGIPIKFCEQSDFEEILDTLERNLRKKSKFNKDIQLLLFKVMKTKKQLGKLREVLTDIERKPSEGEIHKIFKAISADISIDEINAINTEKLPGGDFYNYDVIRNVMLRKLNGEIDDEYFTSWLVLLSNLFRYKELNYISYCFDGYSFLGEYSTKMILEMLATLKDYNYRLKHKDFVHKHKQDKLKVIYLRFFLHNRTDNSKIFKAYYVDYKAKRFDIRIIDDAMFDYRDDLMYCDLSAEYFDECGEYIGQDCESDCEPAEFAEEIQLLDLFYDEGWTYDHELNF